jgi:hypothetical protein
VTKEEIEAELAAILDAAAQNWAESEPDRYEQLRAHLETAAAIAGDFDRT